MPIQTIPDPLSLLRPVSKIITATYTRPANTTAYAAGQVLANSTTAATILTFAGMSRAAGLGFLIDGCTLIQSTAPATAPSLELHLFDTSITMQNDGAAWNPLDADLATSLGYVKFPGTQIVAAVSGGNSNTVLSVPTDIKSRAAAAGATSIFGIVVVRSAYTPASAESFTFRLHVIQD